MSRVKHSGLARFSRVRKTQQIRKICILMRFTQQITQVFTWDSFITGAVIIE